MFFIYWMDGSLFSYLYGILIPYLSIDLLLLTVPGLISWPLNFSLR